MAEQDSLFAGDDRSAPLADRMRPRNLNEFVGQDHILGPGRLLRRAIQADQLSSLIFSGPPGTGKTTLARVIANTTKSRFASVNAVLGGVKELRQEVSAAEEHRNLYGRRTILFVDEVHRWNKAQQDALLPWVENGTVILIGATTENPFFEVNKALVSRSRVFLLTPLREEDLARVLDAALSNRERGYGTFNVSITSEAREHLIRTASGDARTLLNALELAVETTPDRFPPPEGGQIVVDLSIAEESIQRRAVLYDKEGDYHFDTISAFIKSLRGSDPDAALYWLATMVAAGEDPRFIFRRMLISASEDVGLADPHALTVVASAAAAFDRVGMPEGNFHLAHAALYLAGAPKSNSTLGFFDALDTVRTERGGEVPNHLRDASRDAKGFGHGEGYLYPHAYREHWVAQQYLPESLQGVLFYQPGQLGWEGERRSELLQRRELQLSALREQESSREVLTFTPDALSPRSAAWRRRGETERQERLMRLRERLLEKLEVGRHQRLFFAGTPADLLIWELLRRVPEGQLLYLPVTDKEKSSVAQESERLDPLHRPRILEPSLTLQRPDGDVATDEGGSSRDNASCRDAEAPPEAAIILQPPEARATLKALTALGPGVGMPLLFALALPAEGTKLSQLLEPKGSRELVEHLESVEQILYTPGEREVRRILGEGGFELVDLERLETHHQRLVDPEALKHWLDPGHPGYGEQLLNRLGASKASEVRNQITAEIEVGEHDWRRVDIICRCRYTGPAPGPQPEQEPELQPPGET
ncbi:MAG: AAA family ATPase [Alkalispirochaetaceae bacterium]